MKKYLSILLVCILALCAAVGLGACEEEEPETQVGTYQEESVSLDSEGETLGLRVNVPDGATEKLPVMILCVGLGNKYSFLNDLAAYYAQRGYVTIRFDYTCVGLEGAISTGDSVNMTPTSQQNNITAILDYIASDGRFDRDRVALLGYSLGGLISALYTSNHPDSVKELILMAPAFDMQDVAKSGSWFGVEFDPADPPESVEVSSTIIGRNFLLECGELNLETQLTVYSGPVLLCTGTADDAITYSRWANGFYQNSTLIEVEGGTHLMILQKPQAVTDALDSFLAQNPF